MPLNTLIDGCSALLDDKYGPGGPTSNHDLAS